MVEFVGLSDNQIPERLQEEKWGETLIDECHMMIS
jgi:hypothetical protein